MVSGMRSVPMGLDPDTSAARRRGHRPLGLVRRGWWWCQSSFQIRWSAPEAAHATSAVNAALPSVTVPRCGLSAPRHDRRTGTRSLTARHVVTGINITET